MLYLVDVSDIFYFFSARGGKGESEAPGQGGAVGFFIENPGGGFPGGGGDSRRGEGFQEGCLERIGEAGGGKYIFWGRNGLYY